MGCASRKLVVLHSTAAARYFRATQRRWLCLKLALEPCKVISCWTPNVPAISPVPRGHYRPVAGAAEQACIRTWTKSTCSSQERALLFVLLCYREGHRQQEEGRTHWGVIVF